MFHTYVASVLSGYCVCLQWFSSVFASVSSVFRHVLHLDVSKVDRVLHMGCAWEAADDVDDVGGGGHCWCAPSRVRHARCLFPPYASSVQIERPGASQSDIIAV